MTATLVDARPTGLCECGCGRPTRVENHTDARYGAVRGRPRRFLVGHNARLAGSVRPAPKPGPPPADAPDAEHCVAACGYPLTTRVEPPPGWRQHVGRGLCAPCHRRKAAAGELIDFERRTRSRDEVLDDWDLLRRGGVPRSAAAARIGVTVVALESHIYRGRRVGDPRAVLGTP